MQILALKYFLAVVDTGSIRHAAAELHVSPSALSRQIQNLEHGFKTPLFDRRASGMHLTEEGRILASHMRRTVREMERARSRIDDLHGMVSGTIRYATIEGALKTWLFPAIAAFQKRYPDVVFEGEVVGSDAVYTAISNDQVDFGVAMESELPQEIDVLERFDTRFVAVMGEHHPLATRKSLTLAEICPYRLAMLSPRFQTRQLVNSSVVRQRLDLNVIFELDHIEMLMLYVQATGGLTILPSYAVSSGAPGNLITVGIQGDELAPCATLICKRHDRHLIQAASHFIEEACLFRPRTYTSL